ncbi:hypothetical protein QBC45DRAFT_405419 [Copromyces sp. CBS 386.78]|nr:hypothetical protein QBC45DRAFT_405419 [Copromyces sp. CBS 386.78]
MDRFNFLPQGLRRNNAAPAATTATDTAGTDPNINTNGQPAPLPAVYNQNQNQRAQNPYTYPDSVSSLSSDDEYTDDDMYEDEQVYSVSSRSSDTVPLSPHSRQQRSGGQPNYPSSSTLNHQNQNMNAQDDLYCDLEAQLGIHPAFRVPQPGPGNNIPPNFPPPPPIPQSQEMAEVERRSSSRFFLPRMSFRFLGGGGGRPRPASSHYSGDGQPPATEVNFPASSFSGRAGHGADSNLPVSPKSPAYNFRIGGEQQLPTSTRLHVPGVERSSSQGRSHGEREREGGRGASRYGFGVLGGGGGRRRAANASREGHGRTVRVTEPRRTATATRRHRSERDGERERRERRRRREGSGRSRAAAASGHRSRSHRSRRDPGRRSGTTTAGTGRHSRDARDDERRKRRKKKSSHSHSRHGRHEGSGSHSHSHSRSATAQGSSERERERRKKRRAHAHAHASSPPKHFLFCFPWVRSRTRRTLILRSFVSGLFLACLLIIYLALTLSHTISSNEFTISMILVVILGAIVFLHSVVRLIMLAFRGGGASSSGRRSHNMKPKDDMDLETGQAHHTHTLHESGRGPPYNVVDIHAAGPAGPYAIPPTPIRVVLARDEEAAGIPSEAAVVKPPEYGQWRESVRVDPNRIYWMRNEAVSPALLPSEQHEQEAGAGAGAGFGFGSEEGGGAAAQSRPTRTGTVSSRDSDGPTNPGHGTLRRPPSYSSDDGVSYVVEAQPRSIAPPVGDVPIATAGGNSRAGRRLA